MSDYDFMKLALDLAKKGKGSTSPNPMVGAVIVKGNRVISTGLHKRCGSEHAEIIAFKKAKNKARGARLYVTLEPCFHYGRTPPCVDKVIESGITEVIIAMIDPNPLTRGKSVAKLKRAGIKVRVGVLCQEAQELNEVFIKYMSHQMPFVAAKCAQSLDGKIATATGESKWITSVQAREYAHKIRDEFDAICVGVKTVLKDNPGLNGTKKNKQLKKIILDSSLKTPLDAELFKGVDPKNCFIAVSSKAADERIEQFQKEAIRVIKCPLVDDRIDLKWLLKALAKEEITSILLEGGAHVVGSALKHGLVDKFFIYVAPKIIGDQKALSSVVGVNIHKLQEAIELKKITVRSIGPDILVTGYV